ncbi:hypothetical protein SBA4_2730025 [Candidatus Sulfopaludibacter sp. SbA4]|nr:hypothetical protein SBA4_2730025 [Candidatus Sulfopaludibacter sp. SbA4]
MYAHLYCNTLKSSQPATIWWGGPPGGAHWARPTPWSAFGCGSAALYYNTSISFPPRKIFRRSHELAHGGAMRCSRAVLASGS